MPWPSGRAVYARLPFHLQRSQSRSAMSAKRRLHSSGERKYRPLPAALAARLNSTLLLPFKVGPMNGREARQSGLRLKAVDRARSGRARRTFRRQESRRAAERQPRGRRLVDRDLAALLLSASRLCVSHWRGALGSAPTDFCATLVAGASLVSDRVRIGRRSRRPRPVAGHGLDHKPP
jgi:hypothetical protein